MKKNFQLTDTKLAPARQVDAVKHEIKKYIARERRKKLSEDFDHWDFDCKIGEDSSKSHEVSLSDINKSIDEFVAKDLKSFYLEILAKQARRLKKSL